MKRILIIYNPHSSRFHDIKKEVLDHLSKIKGYIIGKYEVDPSNIDKNTDKLAKLLRNGDLVISAGGDATGIIAVNAIFKSGKDVTLSVLPYGNFNDLSRTLGVSTLEDVFSANNHPGYFYPLDIIVDGKHCRYATCYVTIGMTAESVKLYDEPAMRKILKKPFGRKVSSYTHLIGWYFKNRHKKRFLPDFRLNGKLQPQVTSDYIAVNGRFMARVLRIGDNYKNPTTFHSKTCRLINFGRLFYLISRSVLLRIPGAETDGDILEFEKPATVKFQAEGEFVTCKNVRKIEIRKADQCLKTIMK